ncbi:hypothetical protein Fmac_026409 [Flemingia macrophylla]|uniref:Uncharacterized protein n=1 Tax=Flemingia macrophylla TaxID=520843 RepID=A0ABD1LES7_9FABA
MRVFGKNKIKLSYSDGVTWQICHVILKLQDESPPTSSPSSYHQGLQIQIPDEAVPVLQRTIQVPDVSRGPDHALAAFSGYMQLGDTFSMLGHVDKSISSYHQGLRSDPSPRRHRSTRRRNLAA